MINELSPRRTLVLKKPSMLSMYYNAITPFLDKLAGATGTYNIRRVQPKDSEAVKALIKKILLNRGGVGVDAHYYDTELTDVYESYQEEGAAFQVVTYKGEIIGTVGIKAHQEFAGACEIKKLYVAATHQGQGHENSLLQAIKSRAYQLGYKSCKIAIENREMELMKTLTTEGFDVDEVGKGQLGITTLSYSFI